MFFIRKNTLLILLGKADFLRKVQKFTYLEISMKKMNNMIIYLHRLKNIIMREGKKKRLNKSKFYLNVVRVIWELSSIFLLFYSRQNPALESLRPLPIFFVLLIIFSFGSLPTAAISSALCFIFKYED